MELLDDFQRIINVVLGLGIFFHQLRLYILMRQGGLNGYKWIRLAYSIIGLYWAVLYFLVIVKPPVTVFTKEFSSTFVLPAISITLALIFASTIIAVKRTTLDDR